MHNSPVYPQSVPPNPPTPGTQRGSGTKTILIIAGVLVLLCCLCSAIAGVGLAAYIALVRPSESEFFEAPTPVAVITEIVADTEVPEDTLEPQATAVPGGTVAPEDTEAPTPGQAMTQEPTAQPVAATPSSAGGLGVSRQEMMDFFGLGGAFDFGEPQTIQGTEIVQGTHKSLCVQKNCAAVALGGPAEDLLVISVVAPTDPQDKVQTLTSLALLMTAAGRFSDPQDVATLPKQVMNDLLQAQTAGKDLEKKIESNGYVFTETYNAQTHNAGLAITRPK